MGRLVEFKNKKRDSLEGSAEGDIYPPEVEAIEKEIETKLRTLRQKVLKDGIHSITKKDAEEIDFLSFKASLLYDIYDLEIEEDI